MSSKRILFMSRVGLMLLAILFVIGFPMLIGDIGIGPFLNLEAFLAVVVAPVLLALWVYGKASVWRSLFAGKSQNESATPVEPTDVISFTVRSSWFALVVLLVIEAVILFGIISGPSGPIGKTVQIIFTGILYSALATLFWWRPLRSKIRIS